MPLKIKIPPWAGSNCHMSFEQPYREKCAQLSTQFLFGQGILLQPPNYRTLQLAVTLRLVVLWSCLWVV